MITVFDIVAPIISIVICLTAFIYSAIQLSKKNSSRYFVFLNLASGCYAVQEICASIYSFCGNVEYVGFETSTLGVIGCVLFIFAANFAVLEKKIEKNEIVNKASKIAILAPIIVLAFTIVSIILSLNTDYTGAAILIAIILLPFYPASYLSLKHLLLIKDVEVCKKTKGTNLVVFIFLLTNLLFLMVYFFSSLVIISIVSIVLAIEVALLSLLCVKEAKQWKI